ncbi:MAG: DHA2 family efflux MFS transporter permease subunit [Rhodoluna sp.]|jgi:EmrB/QacA subfamily drug resistance transporter
MARLARLRWIGLVFISMAISLVIIDGTIVNTIFPKIITALSINSVEVQWVQESYVLVFAALLLVWGSVADRIGRRRLLIIGILIFIVASVWAGVSDSATQLILARILQGFGGSMVLPTTLSLVNANFQGKERGIAFAVWGATIGGMVAVGPVIGGWLATSFGEDGWRLAFNINLPIGLIIIAGLLLFVSESKVEQRTGSPDIVGAVLSVLMFLTLVFGLIEGRTYGWWSVNKEFVVGSWSWGDPGFSVIPVALILSVIFTVVFILWEKKREKAEKPVLLDLNLFSVNSFRNGSIAALIISMGEFGILFAIPLWLQNVLGLSPVDAGIVLLWLAGGAFLASAVGGALSGKLAPAMAVRIGVGLELLGVIGVAVFANSENFWPIAGFLFVYGLGIGLATAQLTGVIMVDVPMDKIGQASGSQSTVRQVGSALGIAVLGTVLFTQIQSNLASKLKDLGMPDSIAEGFNASVVESAGGSIQMMVNDPYVPIVFVQAAKDAFTDGVRWSAVAAAIFLFLGFIATFRLAKTPHGEKAE